MGRWLRKVVTTLLGVACVVATGALTAFASALAYVWITNLIWPLEVEEAAGPQLAGGIIILFAIIPCGFLGGCVLAVHLWMKLDGRPATPSNGGSRAIEEVG